ncbi:MAG: methyltransferase domain-containing protein [Acidobacteriia bacterium]|nr:methyltransferase domain-containing protein [Terriglobia bacterium]
MPEDFTHLLAQSVVFEERLRNTKASLTPDFPWYPYDSFGNLHILDSLLQGPRRYLLDLIGSDPVLDFGCADGDLAFFLESLGCQVHCYDQPPTNHNGMRGVQLLQQTLASSIQIHKADLDAGVRLTEPVYSLACLLGILYHLKNPFHVLESVAAKARYLLLSTRVARFTPDRSIDFKQKPMAYLLAPDELNDDESNYWIFSESGLRRLLERTNWQVLDFITVGSEDSDPVNPDGDQRAFCIARSLVAEPVSTADLLSGWHELENQRWRWTARRFSAIFRNCSDPSGLRLALQFTLDASLLDRLGPLRLSAVVNGVPLAAQTYAQAGAHLYSAPLPAQTRSETGVTVEFELDKALLADPPDQRHLGLVVSQLSLG